LQPRNNFATSWDMNPVPVFVLNTQEQHLQTIHLVGVCRTVSLERTGFPMVSQFFDNIDTPKTSLHSRRSHHIGVHRGSPRGVIFGDSHGREFGCLSESTSLLHTFERRRGSGYTEYTDQKCSEMGMDQYLLIPFLVG